MGRTGQKNRWLFGVAMIGMVCFGCGTSPMPEPPESSGTLDPSAHNGQIASGDISLNSSAAAVSPIDPAALTTPADANATPDSTNSTITTNASNTQTSTQVNTPTSTQANTTTTATTPSTASGAGQIMIPIGTIYNQGMSGWCWAYSAFHTLRTYYYNSPATDAATQSWRAAIKKIDSTTALPAALEANPAAALGGIIGGDPIEFINGFRSANNLPAQNWQKLAISDHSAAFNQVAANIRKMIPAVYCDHNHCRMIYGFVSDGAKITQFALADSAANPSPTYLEDVSKLDTSMTILLTLLP